ncbi:hypothetical protein ACOMHN_034923 [Nucella lapillus]
MTIAEAANKNDNSATHPGQKADDSPDSKPLLDDQPQFGALAQSGSRSDTAGQGSLGSEGVSIVTAEAVAGSVMAGGAGVQLTEAGKKAGKGEHGLGSAQPQSDRPLPSPSPRHQTLSEPPDDLGPKPSQPDLNLQPDPNDLLPMTLTPLTFFPMTLTSRLDLTPTLNPRPRSSYLPPEGRESVPPERKKKKRKLSSLRKPAAEGPAAAAAAGVGDPPLTQPVSDFDDYRSIHLKHLPPEDSSPPPALYTAPPHQPHPPHRTRNQAVSDRRKMDKKLRDQEGMDF